MATTQIIYGGLSGQSISATTLYGDGSNLTGVGGGLGGTQYIVVSANGTPQENAAELQVAYDLSKTMSPTADNRITVVAAPGNYKFPSTFVMDTEYIDLVSLTGNRDVVFDLVLPTEFNGDPFQFILPSYDITTISECLLIDTDNVHVKGVKGKFYNSPNWNQWWGGTDYVLPIQVGDNLPNIVVENCEGGPFSFGGDETYSYVYKEVNGTFIKCIGGVLSFASIGTASGLFIDCVGAANTFGKNGECSGIFINCKSEAGFKIVGGHLQIVKVEVTDLALFKVVDYIIVVLQISLHQFQLYHLEV